MLIGEKSDRDITPAELNQYIFASPVVKLQEAKKQQLGAFFLGQIMKAKK